MPSRDRLRECDAKRPSRRPWNLPARSEGSSGITAKRARTSCAAACGRSAADRGAPPASSTARPSCGSSSARRGAADQRPARATENPDARPTTPRRPSHSRVSRPDVLRPADAGGGPAIASVPDRRGGRARSSPTRSTDYFTRASDPGRTVAPADLFERVQLHDGRAAVVSAARSVRVGATIDRDVSVTDPLRNQPFTHRLRLVVTELRTAHDRPRYSRRPREPGAGAPKIIEVEEADWRRRT